MHRIQRVFVLFAVLVMADLATGAQVSRTIENVAPRSHFAPAGTSTEQLAAAITLAAGDKGWRIIDSAPGVLTASTLVRRKHEAVVTIGYDATNFWIDYKDSKNLNYDPKDRMQRRQGQTRVITRGPRIHPNYNVWVAALADQIAIRARKPPAPVQPAAAPRSEAPSFVADELHKLDALRKRGVLTEEEFEEQKAKLLGR